MNKPELISAVAEKAGMTKKDATAAVNATLDILTERMVAGDSVALIGFGTFTSKKRAARTAKNPRTGEPVKVAAARVPAFKAGKGLKDAVNGK